MLTWNDIADRINKMTEEEKATTALTIDTNTGELCGFNSIDPAQDHNENAPKSHFIIVQEFTAFKTKRTKGPIEL